MESEENLSLNKQNSEKNNSEKISFTEEISPQPTLQKQAKSKNTNISDKNQKTSNADTQSLINLALKDLKEVVSIRGYGMMGGIEMKMKDKPGKSGFQTFKHCYDAGVNFKNTGDTLIIAPQFICEKKHIDEIIEKLRKGISNYTKS